MNPRVQMPDRERPIRLYCVARHRKHMYGDAPMVLPARNQRAAVAMARLLVGPGDWRATGPLDGGHVVDGVVRSRLSLPSTFSEVAAELDRVWSVWTSIA